MASHNYTHTRNSSAESTKSYISKSGDFDFSKNEHAKDEPKPVKDAERIVECLERTREGISKDKSERTNLKKPKVVANTLINDEEKTALDPSTKIAQVEDL